MKKEGLLILSMVALAGVLLFADQVWEWLSSMGPLEAVKQIMTFILHVTVGTVCAYVVFGLPKIVKPWAKMLKRSSRRWRSGPNAHFRRETQVPAQPRLRFPKLTARLELPNPTRRSAASSPNPRTILRGEQVEEPRIDIRF